jgi:hypothetical protein
VDAPTAPLRSNRAVVVAVVVAAVAVTALSLVGIASLLGWLPERAPVRTAATAAPEDPAPRTPHTELPPIGASGKRQEPLMPKYGTPEPPPPAPAVAAEPPPAAPAQAPVRSVAAPRVPSYVAPARPGRCDACGRVTGVSSRGEGWEIRVRFEDGAARTYRYRSRPPFEAGDRVRANGAVLEHD